MIWESLDKSISNNSQYIRSEITKSAIDKELLAYSKRIGRNLSIGNYAYTLYLVIQWEEDFY